MADQAIHAVIFDFGGVFTRSQVVHDWLRGYDEQLGLAPGSVYMTLFSGEPWERVSTGQMSYEAYWDRVGRPYEEQLPPEFGLLRRGLFHAEPINEEVIPIARRLGERYPLALCSNAVFDLEEVLAERPDIRRLFQVVVVSMLVGLRKPNPAILTLTAERLGVPPTACLLIDDKLRNTSAAARIGMPGIVFSSAQQLAGELEVRGLLPAAQALAEG